MTLRVLIPTRVLLEEEVQKVVAEGREGTFCLLPRHVDVASALVPGILSYVPQDGQERFMAVDHGSLIKRGGRVVVSTQNAVTGEGLGTLKETVEEQFLEINKREETARSMLARMEADVVRRFLEMGQA